MTPDERIAARAVAAARAFRDRCPLRQLRAARPTRYLPGDPRKDKVLRLRIRFRLPLYIEGDARMPARWYWGDNQRGDNGRDVQRTLYDAAGGVVLVKRLIGTKWHIIHKNDYGDLREKPSRRRNSA